MNDKQFFNEFYSVLEKAMEPNGGHLIEMDIPKNNASMKGITIKFDNISIAPTIYPDLYYPDWKDGQSMDDIVSGIKEEIIKTAPELSRFSTNSLNRDSAVNHLYASVVGYESNKEWLKNIPHERLADLAVFAKWKFDTTDSDSVMMAKVTEQFLAHLQLTKEEALKIAKTNTAHSAKFESMEAIMTRILIDEGMDKEMAEAMTMAYKTTPFHILTNEHGIHGAAVIACPDVLKAVQKQTGEDFYILPSSIHEVLILPKSQTDDVKGLKAMVSSINKTEVVPEERLSNQIYEFDGHILKIAGAGLTQKHDIAESITYHRSR